MAETHQFQFLVDQFSRPSLKGVVDVVLDKQPDGAPVATIVHKSDKREPITHVVTTHKAKGALFDHFTVESFRGREEGPFAHEEARNQTFVVAHLISQLRANP